ncbi:hypothetical protein BH18ACT15_BH18ACT15_06580 [soil metagenome]
MKTAVSIPDAIFKAAERMAERLGVSRSELYARAVSEFLEARLERAVTEQLDEVYEEDESELDTVLERMQAVSLPREEW